MDQQIHELTKELANWKKRAAQEEEARKVIQKEAKEFNLKVQKLGYRAV